jgi:hypothetical protein
MPNWCNNTITINADEKVLDSFENFLEENNGKGWFSFFRPIPQEIAEGDEWYGWALQNWGCKWNCDAQDWTRDDEGIHFWFDSPWGPPIELYEFLDDSDINVDASFLEEGMSFVGRFYEGESEEYEYESGNPESLEDIPEYLIEHWNLYDLVEDGDDETFIDVNETGGKW